MAATRILVVELRPGADNDETLIDFLNEVHELEQPPCGAVDLGTACRRSAAGA